MLEDLHIEGLAFLTTGETDDDVTVPALVDILPPSLKCLNINFAELENEERDQMFNYWEAKRSSAIPNLELIAYDGEKIHKELQAKIRSSNVRLERQIWWADA